MVKSFNSDFLGKNSSSITISAWGKLLPPYFLFIYSFTNNLKLSYYCVQSPM